MVQSRVAMLLVVPFALATAACTKSSPEPVDPNEATVDPIIAPMLAATPSPPPPPASAIALLLGPSASPLASSTPSDVANVHARANDRSARASDADAATCGSPPLPDCPMMRWMKENAIVPVLAPDFPMLGDMLRELATLAPTEPGYPYWRSICLDGADAADVEDLEAVHAACRGCHNQYQKKYVMELRSRSLPKASP